MTYLEVLLMDRITARWIIINTQRYRLENKGVISGCPIEPCPSATGHQVWTREVELLHGGCVVTIQWAGKHGWGCQDCFMDCEIQLLLLSFVLQHTQMKVTLRCHFSSLILPHSHLSGGSSNTYQKHSAGLPGGSLVFW